MSSKPVIKAVKHGLSVSVTGTHFIEPRSGAYALIADALNRLTYPSVREVTTGGQDGVDVWAQLCAVIYHPRALHRVVLPAAPHSPRARLFSEYAQRSEIVQMPGVATSQEAAYLNAGRRVLAFGCDLLLAFPQHSRPQRFSRTWQRITDARGKGMGIVITPLDGSKPWAENAGKGPNV